MGERVEIVEVGPRDGLQNEAGRIPAALKVALVDSLSRAGFARIEAASFVNPKLVPQMADSDEVLRRIARKGGVRYAALVPNMRGFEDAMAAGADDVAVFVSASEGFSRANANASIAECLERLAPVAEAARRRGVPLRGYVSCVTDCPYDGAVDPGAAARVAARLFEMGCGEVSLGDTLGRATPERLDAMLARMCSAAPAARLAGHYHDTSGRAVENVEVSLARGLRVFDASIGGLGGCPFAPGASGNVATGALHARLAELGWETGLDSAALDAAAQTARRALRGAEAQG